MDRRSFLTSWLPSSSRIQTSRSSKRGAYASPRSIDLPGGLAPFVPSAEAPWDLNRAAHLLRRTTFMPLWADITQIQAMSPSDAVDLLLDTPSTPAPPAMADNETESLDGLDQVSRNIVEGKWRTDAAALRTWMVGVMTNANGSSKPSIAEKMTLFWSGHFTTEFEADLEYVVAPLLYRQNKLYRENGLKNFKDLVAYVTLDGAMLVYLGGNLNSVGRPNENYARELLELFTTGLGWYTEGDVQNAARILTGWRIAQFSDKPKPNGKFTTYFDPAAHDVNAKQFLGESFPARDASTNTEFLVRQGEIRKLVDTIFERRPEAVAKFICTKLYHFFVYSDPRIVDDPASVDDIATQSVIAAMTQIFIDSGFEIKPVVAALLKSEHFFDNANIGAQIKTPVELAIGFARQMATPTGTVASMNAMGQVLFDPPNVSGWSGYHDWITTSTFPRRSELGENVLANMDDATTHAFIAQFPEHTNAGKLIDNVGVLLLPRPLSIERKAALVATLTAGAPDYEWANILSSSPSTAARNMRDALRKIIELPDFQLA